MKRSAVGKAAAVGVLAVLMLAGAVGIYYYTLAPASKPSSTILSSSSTGVSTSSAATSSTQTGPAGGSCIKDAQGDCQTPQGAWADYLGYIPAGYTPAPHYAIAATYPCPSGMDAQQCATFQQTCGNGVCDPNESCATCPIDCGIQGELTCDPYTGRAGAPISVCQVAGIG